MYSFEPKYFIYAQDVQVGPLLRTQLVDEIEKQNLGQDAFVWAEGMRDWVRLSQYQELERYVEYLPETTNLFGLQRQSELFKSAHRLTAMIEEDEAGPQPASVLQTGSQEVSTAATAVVLPQEIQKLQAIIARVQNWKTVFKNKYVLSIGAGVLLGLSFAIYQGTRPSLWEHLQATPEQIKDMRWAQSQTGAENAIFTLAPMKGDPREPRFALATNLPEGTRLQVSFVGIRSTLVGAMGAHLSTEVEVQNGFAVTRVLRRADGAFMPVGAYKVKVDCVSCAQKENQQTVWMERPVFIGEATGDYKSQLAQFHQLMTEQAQSELQELNEIYQFLYQVIGDRLRKKPLSSQQRVMFQQLGEVLKPQPDEGLAEHFVLHFLYRDLIGIYQGLQQMPAELGVLRRQLDQLQAKHHQAQAGLKNSFLRLLDSI